MRTKAIASICAALVVTMIWTSGVWAAKKKQPAPQAPLSEAGQRLEAQYQAMLNQLKAQITQALPKVNDQTKAAFLQAHKAQMAAEADVEAAKKDFGGINKAEGLVHHGQWWVSDAAKQIAKAQAALKKATTDEARAAAKKTIEDQTKRKAAGELALKEREAALAKAKQDQDALNKHLDKAKAQLAAATAAANKALDALNPKAYLTSNKLDPQLIKFEVLNSATPRGLAEFASQSSEQQALVNKLLSDEDLMRQMVLADGPTDGKYGQAMRIYTDIQKASPKANNGNLQRLALAVALEHAQPIKQGNPSAATDAPQFVDPVKRYLSYEKAFEAGELDPAFKNFSAWEYRFVVDGDEPDETIEWGRKMLRNYRPDEITTKDYRWRYVDAVKTEVQYGSGDQKYDLPTLQNYQNIIANGGVCGRRAFFGRFILRAFGIPVTARPQSGHAALAHWTPKGWVVNLGAGWGSGWTKTIYGDDLNFLAVTQARAAPDPYIQVQRAHWIGDVEGEHKAYGFGGKQGATGFWNIMALGRRQEIIRDLKAETLAAVGTDIGEANESKEADVIEAVTITDKDKKITVSSDGVITLPAAATSKPTNSTGKIRFMPSTLGGLQLHSSRNGGAEPFEYTFDTPSAGTYELTARVVTTSDRQHLLVAANGAADPTDIALPYTIGMWGTTDPVKITLKPGRNVLQFSRPTSGVKGLTIKDFTLTPVK